jgi:hypothetical protein
MDEIYKGAYQVIAYLGEETPSSSVLFRELATVEEEPASGNRRPRPSPTDEIVRALIDLFERPWFSRVWVLQEAFHAQRLTFMCGISTVEYEVLLYCLWGYGNPPHFPVTGQEKLKGVFEVGLEVGPNQNIFCKNEGYSLFCLLERTRHCLATDPRDHV